MRLLNVKTLQLSSFEDDRIPPYAIASHRWEAEETTYDDVDNKRKTEKAGYKKVMNFCSFTQRWCPDIEWIWIDTCCIDKKSSAELSESINSMFRWYANADVCFAYLADVEPLSSGIDTLYKQFENSVWFTRGWTLQELLASKIILFTTQHWEILGAKGGSIPNTLSTLPRILHFNLSIADITNIPPSVLMDYEASRGCSDDQKWTWVNGRTTTKVEDMAYCLLGIFGVNLPLIYGEGDQATVRLRDEIRSRKRRLKQKEAALAKARISTLSVSTVGTRRETNFWKQDHTHEPPKEEPVDESLASIKERPVAPPLTRSVENIADHLSKRRHDAQKLNALREYSPARTPLPVLFPGSHGETWSRLFNFQNPRAPPPIPGSEPNPSLSQYGDSAKDGVLKAAPLPGYGFWKYETGASSSQVKPETLDHTPYRNEHRDYSFRPQLSWEQPLQDLQPESSRLGRLRSRSQETSGPYGSNPRSESWSDENPRPDSPYPGRRPRCARATQPCASNTPNFLSVSSDQLSIQDTPSFPKRSEYPIPDPPRQTSDDSYSSSRYDSDVDYLRR